MDLHRGRGLWHLAMIAALGAKVTAEHMQLETETTSRVQLFDAAQQDFGDFHQETVPLLECLNGQRLHLVGGAVHADAATLHIVHQMLRSGCSVCEAAASDRAKLLARD